MIQASSQKAVDAISNVSTIIRQVNDISNAIASSVEQQTATANEIARSVTEAATGSNEVTNAIMDVSSVTKILRSKQQACKMRRMSWLYLLIS